MLKDGRSVGRAAKQELLDIRSHLTAGPHILGSVIVEASIDGNDNYLDLGEGIYEKPVPFENESLKLIEYRYARKTIICVESFG